jgi:hypothetical protein
MLVLLFEFLGLVRSRNAIRIPKGKRKRPPTSETEAGASFAGNALGDWRLLTT